MKTSLIQKIGAIILLPFITISMLLLSQRMFSNTTIADFEVNAFTQDTTLLQDSIIIMGRVVDLDHNALEGVIVKDNNINIQKMTDVEGKFKLIFSEPTVISFIKIGLYSVDLNVAESDSNLVIILTPKSNELVVRGFEDPQANNTETNWELNYIDTLKTNQPMYIIDDVKMKIGYDINLLDPNDIKSISVLKDASAINMQNDAKNGIVIITTKNYMNQANDKLKINNWSDTTSTLKMKYDQYNDSIEKGYNENMMKVDIKKDSTKMNGEYNRKKKD